MPGGCPHREGVAFTAVRAGASAAAGRRDVRRLGPLDHRARGHSPEQGGEGQDPLPVGVLVAWRLVVQRRHRGLRRVLAHRAQLEGGREHDTLGHQGPVPS